MKRILFLLLFSCFANSHSLQAQTIFAPLGAQWHNTFGDCGVLYTHSVADTTISGISCRQIKRQTHIDSFCYIMGIYSSTLPSLYVYSNSDTVFVYNSFFNRFTPFYVFNVNDGDTVRLPVLPTGDGMLSFASADSTFSFVVDSVRMKLYDTAILKTVYTRSLGHSVSGRYVYSYGGSDTSGTYTERIGAVSIGLLPRCLTCAYIPEVVFEDSLRCYNDSTLSVKLTIDSCDILPYVPDAIHDMKQDIIPVFPNPTKDVLHINTKAIPSEYLLLDAVGSVMLHGVLKQGNNDISIMSVANGLYLLEIYHGGIRTDIVKVVKQ